MDAVCITRGRGGVILAFSNLQWTRSTYVRGCVCVCVCACIHVCVCGGGHVVYVVSGIKLESIPWSQRLKVEMWHTEKLYRQVSFVVF